MFSRHRRIFDQRFDIVRWFSVTGFVAILILSLVSAWYFSQIFTRNILEHDAHVMTEFVNSIIRQSSESDISLTTTNPSPLTVFFEQLSQVPGIIRANVYSTEHKILWSSHAKLVDQHFSENDELDTALSGTPVANLEDHHELSKAEHILLPSDVDTFVEYYLPIWKAKDKNGDIIAVAEVYRVPLGLSDQLVSIKRSVWTAIVTGGLFLFLSLFWTVRRASRVIKSQDLQIAESSRLVTIGEMASTVAHGLRNPLASIRSSAELAMENNNESETDRLLELIIEESDTMEAWVRQYLSEMKVQEGVTETCLLHSVIEQSLQTLAHHPGFARNHFVREIANEQVDVSFNCMLLTQIIVGLLSNAIEAQPQDNIIRLEVCPGRRIDEVILNISEHGIGISQEQQQIVFEPFYSTKRNGLGVGLSLTRQILKRHHGAIDIASAPGKGTTVCVYLRIAKS